jgi:hypothetical protein
VLQWPEQLAGDLARALGGRDLAQRHCRRTLDKGVLRPEKREQLVYESRTMICRNGIKQPVGKR